MRESLAARPEPGPDAWRSPQQPCNGRGAVNAVASQCRCRRATTASAADPSAADSAVAEGRSRTGGPQAAGPHPTAAPHGIGDLEARELAALAGPRGNPRSEPPVESADDLASRLEHGLLEGAGIQAQVALPGAPRRDGGELLGGEAEPGEGVGERARPARSAHEPSLVAAE